MLVHNTLLTKSTRTDLSLLDLRGEQVLVIQDTGRALSYEDSSQILSSHNTQASPKYGYGSNFIRAGLALGAVVLHLSSFTSEDMRRYFTALLVPATLLEDYGFVDKSSPILAAQLFWEIKKNGQITVLGDERMSAYSRYVFNHYSPLPSAPAMTQFFDRSPNPPGNIVVVARHRRIGPNNQPPLTLTSSPPDLVVSVRRGAEPTSYREFAAYQYLRPRLSIYIEGVQVIPQHPYANLYRLKRYHPTFQELEQHFQIKQQALADEFQDRSRTYQSLMTRSHAESQQGGGFQALHLKPQLDQLQQDVQQLGDLQRAAPQWYSHPLPPIQLLFGVNIWNRARYGLMIYCDGRLMNCFEPVGPQHTGHPWTDDGCGGIVGFVELRSESFSPDTCHQRILNEILHRKMRELAGDVLWQYWRDFKAEEELKSSAHFWVAMGYALSDGPEAWRQPAASDRAIQRLMYAPRWLYCVQCLSWRMVGREADEITRNHGGPAGWTCQNHPLPTSWKCLRPEEVDRELMSLNVSDGRLTASTSRYSASFLLVAERARIANLQRLHSLLGAGAAAGGGGEAAGADPRRRSAPGSTSSVGVGAGAATVAGGGASASVNRSVSAAGSAGPMSRTATSAVATEAHRGGATPSMTDHKMAPWQRKEEGHLQNLKRCLTYLLPADHALLGEKSVESMTSEELAQLSSKEVLRAHNLALSSFKIRLERELQAAKEANVQATNKINQLLDAILPLVLLLNNGQRPIFHPSNPEDLVTVLSALEDLPAGWVIERTILLSKADER